MSHLPSDMTTSTQRRSSEHGAERSAGRIHAFQSFTSAASAIMGAVMGAAVGGVFGVLAGPPGIWTGALLGALAGGAAGRVISVQEARTSRHDAELDEEIGVTSHNLGRPPMDLLERRS
jgi:hypothetical protein